MCVVSNQHRYDDVNWSFVLIGPCGLILTLFEWYLRWQTVEIKLNNPYYSKDLDIFSSSISFVRCYRGIMPRQLEWVEAQPLV